MQGKYYIKISSVCHYDGYLNLCIKRYVTNIYKTRKVYLYMKSKQNIEHCIKNYNVRIDVKYNNSKL
jgi:hypothetical protein